MISGDEDFREQKRAWIQQQNEIAKQVVVEVLPDEMDSFATKGANHHRFSRIDVNDGMVRLGKTMNERHDKMTANRCCNDIRMYFVGVDVSFPENNDNENADAVAVYVILEYPTFRVVYCATEHFALAVPYVPGFLAFREVEPLHRLVTTQLANRPDLTPRAILVDGNGVWHCRHAGLACFLGVKTGIPSIGVGKTLYYHAGWTKERVSQVVRESVSSAVVKNLVRNNSIPSIQRPSLQQGSEAIDTSTTTTTSSSASSKREDIELSVLLFDRNVAKPSNQEDEKDTISKNKNAANSTRNDNRGVLIQELSCFCLGLAIPLQGQEEPDSPEEPTNSHHSPPHSDGVSKRIMACALVGHGGRQERQNHTRSKILRRISVGRSVETQFSFPWVTTCPYRKRY